MQQHRLGDGGLRGRLLGLIGEGVAVEEYGRTKEQGKSVQKMGVRLQVEGKQRTLRRSPGKGQG